MRSRIEIENLADAMDHLSYARGVIATFISEDDGNGYSLVKFPNTVLSNTPNTSAQPLTEIVKYDVTVNGQYIPKESITAYQNGNDLDIKIQISEVRYGIDANDVVELVGKIGYTW